MKGKIAMLKIAKSLTDLIGNTPLPELSNYNSTVLFEQAQ